MTITYSLTESEVRCAVADWLTRTQHVNCDAPSVVLQIQTGERPGEGSTITAFATVKSPALYVAPKAP